MGNRARSPEFTEGPAKEVASHAAWEGTFEQLCAKLSHFPQHATIAIVGSTRLTGPNARHLIRQIIQCIQPKSLVSGGADGIDTLTAETGRAYNIPVDERLPGVRRWYSAGDKKGFAERNTEIAQACDGLVRIAWVGSTTYGSGWTRDRAREMGKPTAEFWLKTEDRP